MNNMRVMYVNTSSARRVSNCFLRAFSTTEAPVASASTSQGRSPTALGLKPRTTGLPKVGMSYSNIIHKYI